MSEMKVALLRGINVGGTGKLPMADLRGLLAGLGAKDVQTYIQSGNVVFRGDVSSRSISDEIEAGFGFRPRVMVLGAKEFRAAAEANPFTAGEGKEIHLFFCAAPPDIDPDTLRADANGVEKWHLAGKVFYLFSPGGLSKSKLAERLERRLGVAATARNWNTIGKLLTMLGP